jgi:hypothetical protein
MVVIAPLVYSVFVTQINGSYSAGSIFNLLLNRYFNSSFTFNRLIKYALTIKKAAGNALNL